MSKERADVFIRDIANNLDEYRHKWKQYFYLKGYQWDEDLLSDTIVKCYDTISRLGLRERVNESWNYLFKALTTNYIRELQYCRVKNREQVEDIQQLAIDRADNSNTAERKIVSDLLREFEWNYCLEMAEKYCDDFYVFKLKYVLGLEDDKIKKKLKDPQWKKKCDKVVKWLKYNIKRDKVISKFCEEYPDIDLEILN